MSFLKKTSEDKQADKPTASDVASSPLKMSSITQGAAQTEEPKMPQNYFTQYESRDVDAAPVGNKSLELSFMTQGRLGHFIARDASANGATLITLNGLRYRQCVLDVITDVVKRQVRTTAGTIEMDVQSRSDVMINHLTNGVLLGTYLKIRSLHSMNFETMMKFAKKPKHPDPLQILEPFALAISQLGVFPVSSVEKEMIYLPTLSDADAASYLMMDPAHPWSTTKYSQALELAKKIGLRFETVDLSVKLGSSWWLLRVTKEEDIVTLQCNLPEDNFTEATAVLRSLYLYPAESAASNQIFNLAPLGTHDYGAMIRNPHEDIAMSTYYGIANQDAELWKTE